MRTRAGTMPAELAELHPDQWSEPFWAAAHQHRLVVPRCEPCGRSRMPVGPFCPVCGPASITWVPASGTATVHAFTVARQAFHPSLASAVPYVIAVVSFDDHPDIRMVTNIIDVDVESVRIGDRVEVVFDDVDDNVTIPRFTPRRDPT